ncbi:MAG: DUF3108 domain-containing protein [Alphaproteobacteria bacterium]|nr:DUF3108 domain-containing protein [Alphaproteobacteria bacterium]
MHDRTGHRAAYACVFALACLGLAGAALADDVAAVPPGGAQYDLTYKIYAGGINGVTFDIQVVLPAPGKDGVYATRVRAATQGVVALFAPWRLDTVSEGQREDGTLRARRFRNADTWRDRTRTVEIDFPGAGRPVVTMEPPNTETDRPPISDAQLDGALDPISALSRLMLDAGHGCPDRTAVYDGRRRYDMLVEPLGRRDYKASAQNSFTGSAIGCRLTFERVAGFKSGEGRRGLQGTAAEVWLGQALDGEVPLPVRLELDTGWGTMLGHLVQVRAADGTILYTLK